MTTWTQLEAYREILPSLSLRRLAVLEALTTHDGATAMELASWMVTDRANVTPRLNELRKFYNAVHKGEPRACNITRQMAETWWCGPEGGSALKALHVEESAESRQAARLASLRTLSGVHSVLTDEMARFILGMSQKQYERAAAFLSGKAALSNFFF